MVKMIGVTELQRNFRTVLDEVKSQHVPYVVIRGRRPEAALLPYDDFLRLQALQEREVLGQFDRLTARMAARHAGVSDDEIAREVAAARSET